MSNYYEKRDAKVRIARELMRMGWKVYGFKEDKSDSMTDYYDPANWGGIAEKNGYILVVDCGAEKEREITRYNPNYISISEADKNKIESLKNMTVERGASEGEEKASQKLIEKIQAKYKNEGVSQYEVIGKIPAHLGNPTRAMWHLEKDGAYVEKGNKLTVYANAPESYIFNIDTMEFVDRYKKVSYWEDGERVTKDRELEDYELKAVKELKALILKLERIVNLGNSCGDGTKETQEAGDQQQENEKLVKKTIQKVKKVIKPVKVERDFVKVGDYVNYKGNRATHCYWKVMDVNEKIFHYQSTGKKYQEVKNCKRYYNHLSKLNDLYDIFELQEVEEIETVEKWVKVKNTNNKTTTKKAEPKEVEKNINSETVNNDSIDFGNYTIEESEHTKTGEKIYLVKFENKLSKDEYIELNKKIKSLGGWYSKYTHSFIFKENPTQILQENFALNNEQVEGNQEKINSLCNYIVDASSDYITENELSKSEYWNDEGYRKNLIEKLKEISVNRNTLKTIILAMQVHEEYREYKKLIEVLNSLYNDIGQKVA